MGMTEIYENVDQQRKKERKKERERERERDVNEGRETVNRWKNE